ncbi:aminoglycoside 6-adenylyltransferase [Emticicia agri]|uniref:Uncharacterized protein n=1 Tax=Emticicia agri TaxID=2492393 RepID=A0A4Q5LU43_9BACT|nr:aminoglycoside 6-adenylyltransferase [Emticicia agri]RYU93196.1 hypothetical protein EWM59_23250 [Emticicia agri]
MHSREAKLTQITNWAKDNPAISVVLLTSSLANPDAIKDYFQLP